MGEGFLSVGMPSTDPIGRMMHSTQPPLNSATMSPRSVRRSALSILLIGMGLAVSACSAEPAPTYDGVPPSEFAAAACSGWLELESVEDANELLGTRLSGTGPEQRAEALAAAQAQLDRMTAARDAVQASTPAIAEGPEVVQPFLDYYDARIAIAQPLVDEFAGFPTELSGNNDQIRRAFGDLHYAISPHGEGAPKIYPFTEVQVEEIIEAYADEPSCDTLVDVVRYD